ncbi:hypothetical protein GCM10018980_19770 [Streptomyces capoamus]|uniref:Uncharacterized protein n=1 Tax=Streptomyces capoamus TaxID=68183 RepID=A0A919C3Q3_9ACTN|nr:hypothetical protein GCM10010501_33370 [Streptomyces libani subsp. rufus]GHG43116.1 hypothetical protein GCM10018980_19770 [Streptomyces capoamus]
MFCAANHNSTARPHRKTDSTTRDNGLSPLSSSAPHDSERMPHHLIVLVLRGRETAGYLSGPARAASAGGPWRSA